MVTIQIKDKESGEISNEVSINDVIYNQREIEFEFNDNTILSFKDFLFYQNDYELIVNNNYDKLITN